MTKYKVSQNYVKQDIILMAVSMQEYVKHRAMSKNSHTTCGADDGSLYSIIN